MRSSYTYKLKKLRLRILQEMNISSLIKATLTFIILFTKKEVTKCLYYNTIIIESF